MGGKRVEVVKVALRNLGVEGLPRTDLPDAFTSASSTAFSQVTGDGTQCVVGVRAQRPQDSAPFVYLYAVRIDGESGVVSVVSKQRLTVVNPTSVVFAPASNTFATCGARTNIFHFDWSEDGSLAVHDPMDVPHLCPTKGAVFNSTGSTIAALHDSPNNEAQVVFLRQTANGYVVAAMETIAGPAVHLCFASAQNTVIAQLEDAVLTYHTLDNGATLPQGVRLRVTDVCSLHSLTHSLTLALHRCVPRLPCPGGNGEDAVLSCRPISAGSVALHLVPACG